MNPAADPLRMLSDGELTVTRCGNRRPERPILPGPCAGRPAKDSCPCLRHGQRRWHGRGGGGGDRTRHLVGHPGRASRTSLGRQRRPRLLCLAEYPGRDRPHPDKRQQFQSNPDFLKPIRHRFSLGLRFVRRNVGWLTLLLGQKVYLSKGAVVVRCKFWVECEFRLSRRVAGCGAPCGSG